MHWFHADKEGLRQIADRMVERRGFGIIGAELYQNVMDTKATTCEIRIRKSPGRPQATLTCTDNDPTGYVDLTHAYTLFAPSVKKIDPSKAGRFNVGEKMVLAFCKSATIASTKGTVNFYDNGSRALSPRNKREVGSEFTAVIECTNERYEEFLAFMDHILVRPDLVLTVNDKVIAPRKPLRTFTAKLPTEIANDNGELRRTMRLTEVQIFEPLPDETPMIYELGIPVVETGDKWHVNVLQKVPLNVDRDNVTPSYLKELRVAVMNVMYEQITAEDTTSTWVNEATDSADCKPEAVEKYRRERYGELSVAMDPTNPEANAEATAKGFTLIPARGLTAGQRKNLYGAGTLKTSSQQFPLAGKGAYSKDPNAPPVEVISPKDLTAGMREIAEYTVGVAKRLLGKDIGVRFIATPCHWSACYGRGTDFFAELFATVGIDLPGFGELHYNVGVLGKDWFDQGASIVVDDLIIHELGHEYESNHLSEKYYNALTMLGAKLKAAALTEPEWFKRFMR